jgi:hypothetical protein
MSNRFGGSADHGIAERATRVPKWWNWQTRTLEGRVGRPVGVRIPPSAPTCITMHPFVDSLIYQGKVVCGLAGTPLEAEASRLP